MKIFIFLQPLFMLWLEEKRGVGYSTSGLAMYKDRPNHLWLYDICREKGNHTKFRTVVIHFFLIIILTISLKSSSIAIQMI